MENRRMNFTDENIPLKKTFLESFISILYPLLILYLLFSIFYLQSFITITIKL